MFYYFPQEVLKKEFKANAKLTFKGMELGFLEVEKAVLGEWLATGGGVLLQWLRPS